MRFYLIETFLGISGGIWIAIGAILGGLGLTAGLIMPSIRNLIYINKVLNLLEEEFRRNYDIFRKLFYNNLEGEKKQELVESLNLNVRYAYRDFLKENRPSEFSFYQKRNKRLQKIRNELKQDDGKNGKLKKTTKDEIKSFLKDYKETDKK